MDQEITASFVWTVDELIKARENHWRAECRPCFRVVLMLFPILTIIGGWGSYHKHGLSTSALLLPLIGIYFLFLRKYEVRWTLRRHFKKRPDKNAQVYLTMGDNALQIKTEEAELKKNWSQIFKVRKARTGYLLYSNEAMFNWLPSSAFVSDAVRLRAEELLHAKVKDFAEIR